MGKAFEACRRGGGHIRTVKPNKKTYIPICFKGKHSYRGRVHHVKSKSRK